MITNIKDTIEHPSAYIHREAFESIRQAAAAAEGLRDLHPHQLELIFKNQWLKMFVPKQYGGLELSLPEILNIEEGLAWADGSTAWVVTLCSGAAWFVGFLDPDLSAEVFSGNWICFAGSGAPTGVASITSDGYKINGRWKYASGALHATVFTANCMIQKKGEQLYHTDGTPVVRAFLMKRDEVVIHNTWHAMGMVATGSHSFEVKNLMLPSNRCFKIDAKNAVMSDAIYRYPFLQLAETTLAINLSGMAVRFLDLCTEQFACKIIQEPQSPLAPDLHRVLVDAKAKLNEHRKHFYEASGISWASCVKGNIPEAQLRQVSEWSHALAQQSRKLVNDLYPYCGLSAADTRQEINRVWRNIQTAGQHSLFTCARNIKS